MAGIEEDLVGGGPLIPVPVLAGGVFGSDFVDGATPGVEVSVGGVDATKVETPVEPT